MKTKHNHIENQKIDASLVSPRFLDDRSVSIKRHLRHNESIKQAFVKLAECKLTLKEKHVLQMLSSKNNTLKSTEIAKEIKLRLNCSESTVWNIIKSLRNLRLIRNDCLEISIEGKLITRGKND
ncbi:MAG: HTH domain-containing protein [Nanoarchaeota archaeon]